MSKEIDTVSKKEHRKNDQACSEPATVKKAPGANGSFRYTSRLLIKTFSQKLANYLFNVNPIICTSEYPPPQ